MIGSLLRWKSRQSRPAGWIRLADIASGMLTRPVILSPSFSAFRSLSSCTASAVGLKVSCAAAGCANTNQQRERGAEGLEG